jgi:amino acid adenylation domain-containing protein
MPNASMTDKISAAARNVSSAAGLAAADQRQFAEWNATVQSYPVDVCVPQLVSARAAASPESSAVIAAGATLSYAELERQSNQLAHYLRGLGVGREVCAGICLERSAAMVMAELAVMKAGGAYLPLDPAYPGERLAHILNDAQAPVMITTRHLSERLPAGKWRVITLDGEAAEISRQPATPPASFAAPDDLAYVIYTSGSTGRPKGIEITHRSLLNLVFWHRRTFQITPADRATQISSPGFDAAVWELWPYLTAGASVHVADETTRTTPEALRDWLSGQGITISFLPTALAERVLGLEWPRDTALRALLTGADLLHHHPAAGLPFELVNNYGPTECTVVATSARIPPATQSDGLPPIGRPIANTEAYILGEDMQPVPLEAAGELYIGGAGLARGYRGLPDLTAEKFLRNPFSVDARARIYRTGDRVRYRQDGQIEFLGRMDDQVKIRGYRIEPNEIVTALHAHTGIAESAVVPRESILGERTLVAYFVAAAGAQVSETALREFLRARLPDYMVPSAFVALPILPLTANGKIDRNALPEPHAAGAAREEQYVAPRSPVEQRLAALMAALMGLERVGVNENFFLLGGHSLLGTQVIARVRDAFQVELPLRSLFDAPTVADLSAEIERLILVKLENSNGQSGVR